MELTSECKLDFEKWFLIWLKENVAWDTETPDESDINHFYKFPESMQFGVLVDFFDSKGIKIEIQIITEPTMQGGFFRCFKPMINYNGRFFNCLVRTKKRSVSRKVAIEKSCELYNE